MKTKAAAFKIGFNALGFQSAWWMCVLGVIVGFPLLGPIAMGLYLLIHERALLKGRSELYLIGAAMLIGTISDSIFTGTGFLTYMGGYPSLSFVAPLWITAMWGGFAATLNHSLGWLQGRCFLAALLGGISGPLSYVAGKKFGAINFNYETTVTLIILGVFWALAVPGLLWIQTRLNRSLS
ncbi:MAG: DUF2878 domain-containing protein [FCB group bacterium]|nr:DUF2878 domain-containing protein [FCB group bacterium]